MSERRWVDDPWHDTIQATVPNALDMLWRALRCLLGHQWAYYEAIADIDDAPWRSCQRCERKQELRASQRAEEAGHGD